MARIRCVSCGFHFQASLFKVDKKDIICFRCHSKNLYFQYTKKEKAFFDKND